MGRYHWVRLYALLLMIVLFAVVVLAGARDSLGLYKKAAGQRSVVRSVQGIGNASDVIMRKLSDAAKAAGREQYEQLLELVNVEDDSGLSEEDLEGYFRLGYANKMIRALGKDSVQVCRSLNEFISEEKIENVRVADNRETVIEEETDDAGSTIGLRIKNVTLVYEDALIGNRSDTLSYNIQFPDAVFHAGNEDLFKYCLVARKGIYITGRTSSIIGDVYAGKHSPEECREAEIVYGETGTYGGINILSTQVGIKADRIVSEGDININGSFVVFSPNNGKLDCYAQRLNETEGFSKSSGYTLDGTFHPTRKMDEEPLVEYHDTINNIEMSIAGLSTISTYYDSNNDRLYEGRYRKLLTNSDVEIKSDFTGIVATPGNVIIDKDVNFEGVILCGDRIYAMGNNNIVSSPAVARAVIASEVGEEYGIKVINYIGGMKEAGFEDPDYYVIPYR